MAIICTSLHFIESLTHFYEEDDDFGGLEGYIFSNNLDEDDEADEFLSKNSRLYQTDPANFYPNHGYDYIRRETNFDIENYFNETIYLQLDISFVPIFRGEE